MSLIRIATRNSPLALWQANFVQEQLLHAHPGLEVEIVGMTTKGDQLLDRSLAAVGGKGLFLKELEVSLLNNETDIAVHSMKDVPVDLPKGLEIAAVCERADPRDAFVSSVYQNLYALPQGSKVGTASLRRVSQLKSAFPTLEFIELRGNVNTRLRKLDDGEFDAIILAAAGLIRLGFVHRIKQYISPELCLPAVGQGIVGIECRSDDERTQELLRPLHSRESALVLAAERAMNRALDGGCQVPVAGFAELAKGKIRMRGIVAAVDGSQVLFCNMIERNISFSSVEALGKKVAQELLAQGASAILAAVYDRVSDQAAPDQAAPDQAAPDQPAPDQPAPDQPVPDQPAADQAVPTIKAKARKGSSKAGASEQPAVVLLTRQERYLGNMVSILERLDYQPLHVPAIEVERSVRSETLARIANLKDYTDIVFVSRNAVEIGMCLIDEVAAMPEHIRALTVGSETAKQLYRFGVDAMFPHQGTGAEALLAVKQLADLTDRKILIIRGQAGLDWPQEEMRRRGAQVDDAIVYSQKPPTESAAQLDAIFHDHESLAGVFAHSSQGVINLVEIAGNNAEQLLKTKMVAGSQGIANAAIELGWQGEIKVAESPANKHMMITFSGS